MTSILGKHIRLIRPEKIKQPMIFKDERPKAHYHLRTKTIKNHTGKVVKQVTVGKWIKLILDHGGVVWRKTECYKP